ncbi:hypothetical protein JCM6882_002887 [Rhodosporidiobolus microsporus]
MTTKHTFTTPPQPYTIAVPEADVADLHRRLDQARWPAQDVVPLEPGKEKQKSSFGMGAGPQLDLMRELAAEWRKYSWKETEDYLNVFNHYTVEIEGLRIHFLHERSSRPDAIPLILCHGWPGAFHEFLHAIPLLTEPTAPDAQAFHVVIPSMPGYTFSSPPRTPKWGMEDTARVYDKLMTGLGYESYVAQGGDWGSVTARCLGALHKENCNAVHLNFCPARPPAPFSWFNPRTLLAWTPRALLPDDQRAKLERGLDYVEKGSSYYMMQSLTPRTPAYGLNDSPVGLLAWIGEKMIPSIERASSQTKPTLNRDALFMTLSLYWYTGSIGSSFLPYALNPHLSHFLSDPKYHLPNFALSSFPDEIFTPPARDAARTGNLKWTKEAAEGGHFAALEKPEIFVEHLREAVPVLLKA